MICDVNLLFTYFDEETKDQIETKFYLGEMETENGVTTLDSAKMIVDLPYEQRKELYDCVTHVSTMELTEEMLNNYQFVSNTTLTALSSVYHTPIENYNIDLTRISGLNLIRASKIKIKGINYNGRVISKDGTEYFIITNQFDYDNMMRYLVHKQKVETFLENSVPEYLKESYEALQPLADHYQLTIPEMLIDYLNYRSDYTSYIENKQTIKAGRIIADFMSQISDSFYYGDDLTDLELDMRALSEKKGAYERNGNIVRETFNKKDLYNLFTIHVPGFEGVYPDYNAFAALSIDDLDDLFFNTDNGIFLGQNHLMRYSLKKAEQNISKEATEKVTTKKVVLEKKKDMPKLWSQILKAAKAQKLSIPKTFQEFDQKSPEQQKAIFDKIPCTFKEGDVSYPVEATIIARKVKGGTRNYIQFTYTRVTKTSIPAKHRGEDIVFQRVYRNADYILDIGYDTRSVLTPLTDESAQVDGETITVKDGWYKGYYIYKAVNEVNNLDGNGRTQRTNYIVSPNILIAEKGIANNNSITMHASLNAALRDIENKVKKIKIKDNPLLGLIYDEELNNGKITIDTNNVLQNYQTITSLNMRIPTWSVDTMIPTVQSLFNLTVPEFHKKLSNVKDITLLDTPQKCAAFIVLAYDMFRTQSKYTSQGIIHLMDQSNERMLNIFNGGQQQADLHELITRIDKAGTKTYYIRELTRGYVGNAESTKKMLARFTALKNGENELRIDGTIDGVASLREIMPNVLENVITHFQKEYGVKIESVRSTQLEGALTNDADSELRKFMKPNDRACVKDGVIYINVTKADPCDLYHEIAHIFFGLLKNNNIKMYENFLERIATMQETRLQFVNTYNWLLTDQNSRYRNLADIDKREEAAARVLGKLIQNDPEMRGETFNDTRYAEIMNLISRRIKTTNVDTVDNGFGFTKKLIKNARKVDGDLKEYRRASRMIELLISKNDVIENCF